MRATEPTAPSGRSRSRSSAKNDDSITSEFDRHRQSLLKDGTSSETCGAEVRRYLKNVEADIEKDVDVVKWWEVSFPMLRDQLLTHDTSRSTPSSIRHLQEWRLTSYHARPHRFHVNDYFPQANRLPRSDGHASVLTGSSSFW